MASPMPVKSPTPGVSSSSSSSSPGGISCDVKVSALPVALLVFKSLGALLPHVPLPKTWGLLVHLPGESHPPCPAMARPLQAVSWGCLRGLQHDPSMLSPLCLARADEGCWGPTACPCEPGLPQGFSITGAAPGPSSLSIRGKTTGRAERSLRLASLHGFLSCLSPTNIVPSVSLATRQQCQGRWAGDGLTYSGDVAGSRCLVVPRGPVQGSWHSALPRGYFRLERLGLLVSAIPPG